MSKKYSYAPLKTTVDRTEWDFEFNQAESAEIPACMIYEYGREAPHFIERVKGWRKRHSELFTLAKKYIEHRKDTTEVERILANKLMLRLDPGQQVNGDILHPDGVRNDDARAFLFYFPCFPNSPWLTLDKATRDKALFFWGNRKLEKLPSIERATEVQKELQEAAGWPLNPDQYSSSVSQSMKAMVSAPPIREVESIALSFNGVFPACCQFNETLTQVWLGGVCHEEIHFVVNWAHSHRELKKAFANWLLGKKPGQKKQNPPPKPRRPHKEFESHKGTKPIDRLKQLGAYRVLKQMTVENACHNGKGPYTAVDSYKDAKQAAKKALARMFPKEGSELD